MEKEQKIWFTSDTHFCHNKEFLFGTRGFDNVADMNERIIQNWNSVVDDNDIVYHLGDIMLNDTDEGMRCLARLKGNIYIVAGNHCTNVRIAQYESLPNVHFLGWAYMLRIKKKQFYLSHFPTITRTIDDAPNKQGVINLYGHTHQEDNFYNNNPYMYHVGMDSHNLFPVSLEEILKDFKQKIDELNRGVS